MEACLAQDEAIGDEVKSALLMLYNEYRGVGNLGPLQTLDERHDDGLEDELDGYDAYSQMLREMLLQRKEEQQMEISIRKTTISDYLK
ncbi:Hypothetical predicted protein [Prunus dulcis]|uniref:Uncharacterized protein n=1 Tax=Prunus dulcis TaxID=3755 RepID=A0A5E4F5B6_PRUDU|nr:hypothetical protein L3X38_026395 [Prunus dulcis]VVA23183.1 Hypothetical predicted protein [Prunus dulcis]